MEEPIHQPVPVATQSKQESNDIWRVTAEFFKTVIIIAFVAYVIRIFVLQPFIVEGSSMFPRFQTNDYLLVDKLSYRFTQPQRGAIIVFKYPGDTSVNYVKRVIGLPGERVHLQDGKVEIFNAANPSGIFLNEPYVSAGNMTTATGGKSDFTVGTNQYFVLGDNRQYSSDSREWGFLPKEDLIGRVLIEAYPIKNIGIVSHATYN